MGSVRPYAAVFSLLVVRDMASPQKENGYTPIANEILEALAQTRIPGEARQILDVIIRKTYGFNKKQDAISLSQFILATNLKRPNICRAINKLKQMNIIIVIQKDNGDTTLYRFNKDFDTWKPLSKKITLSKKIMSVIQKDNGVVSKKIHTKDTLTKDTLTKDIAPQNGAGKEIAEIIYLFKELGINPMVSKLYGNKTQREAVERLLKEFGRNKLEEFIKALPIINAKPYWPKSTTPCQLEDNLGKYKSLNEAEKRRNSFKIIK